MLWPTVTVYSQVLVIESGFVARPRAKLVASFMCGLTVGTSGLIYEWGGSSDFQKFGSRRLSLAFCATRRAGSTW